jgi:hypothetical protein
MFKLVALLFLVTNGVQAEKPSGHLTNRTTFPTEGACKSYFDTDAGKKAKSAIDELIVAQDGELVAEMVCEKADAKTEDNTI